MSNTKTHRAVVVSEKGKTAVTDNKPIPDVAEDGILVKVKAITLNPTDWKHVDFLLKPGDSIGCDFSGDIVEIGKAAEEKGFKVGDAVAGFIRGGFVDKDNGTFQEHVSTLPELVWHKPKSLSYEDASSMGGIALSTAVQALYYRLGVPKPWEPSSTPPAPILIWGGSSSVGLFAIALAKLSGQIVVTTASPHNHELLKTRGIDAVFDYKDPEVSVKIKEWGKQYGGIKIALDTISEHGSTKLVADALSDDGAQVVTLLPVKGEGFPPNVKITPILIYSVLKRTNEQDFKDIVEWNGHLPELVDEKKFGNAIPLKILHGGLDGVESGLEYLRKGKASAQKIAFKL